MIDLLTFAAGLIAALLAGMFTAVSLISDEPVRCGFDAIKGAGE